MKSQPRLARVSAAEASLAGSNQEIDHHQLGGDLRVDRLRRQGERVHPHHDFGDLERTEIADHPCLRHASGDRADHRSTLIEALVVKADVVRLLVTGAMLELGVRQLLGGLDRLVHEAEGRGEDQLVALLRQVLDDRDGACVFLHILDVARDDLTLQRLVHRQPALVVRPAPAIVADRPRIDEAELQRLGRETASDEGRRRQADRRGFHEIASGNHAHFFLLA